MCVETGKNELWYTLIWNQTRPILIYHLLEFIMLFYCGPCHLIALAHYILISPIYLIITNMLGTFWVCLHSLMPCIQTWALNVFVNELLNYWTIKNALFANFVVATFDVNQHDEGPWLIDKCIHNIIGE